MKSIIRSCIAGGTKLGFPWSPWIVPLAVNFIKLATVVSGGTTAPSSIIQQSRMVHRRPCESQKYVRNVELLENLTILWLYLIYADLLLQIHLQWLHSFLYTRKIRLKQQKQLHLHRCKHVHQSLTGKMRFWKDTYCKLAISKWRET